MPSLGSAVLQEDLRPGALVTMILTKGVLLPRGHATATADRTTKATATTAKHMEAARRALPVALPGTKQLLECRVGMLDIPDMVATALLLAWVLLPACLMAVLVFQLLLAWAISTLSSSSMLDQPPLLHLTVTLRHLRRPLEMRPHPLQVINLLPPRPQAPRMSLSFGPAANDELVLDCFRL